jgi:hypothetical protein
MNEDPCGYGSKYNVTKNFQKPKRIPLFFHSFSYYISKPSETGSRSTFGMRIRILAAFETLHKTMMEHGIA